MGLIDPYKCIQEMLCYIESEDFAGYDPYDGLNSPLLQLVGSASKSLRIAITQFMRRCPFNLRSVLGIKKGHNPKGIGLFLWGYVKLYAVERKPEYYEAIAHLLDMLDQLKSEGYSGNCWGYNFDWQSRSYMRPKGTPTIVNTSFIGHALLDCFELVGEQRALDMAVSIKDFILNDLNRTQSNGGFCFSYTPIDTSVVHNANLLGASILARLMNYCDDDRLHEMALASLEYSMRRQQQDGSWSYGDIRRQKWIDSFHTGFNLQAIRYILQEGLAGEYESSYHKGVRFYANNFFLIDGTPKYYHNRIYPIDIHSAAQAVCFFSSEGAEYKVLRDRIVRWMLVNLYSGKGYFFFRKGKFLTNRIPYMRWSQAWAFHALADYLFQCAWEGMYLDSGRRMHAPASMM